MPHVSWNPNVHCHVNNNLPLWTNQNVLNQVHRPTPSFLINYINRLLSSHLCLRLQSGLFSSSFPIKIVYYIITPMSYMFLPFNFPLLNHPDNIGRRVYP
jgi:hypothetical protein